MGTTCTYLLRCDQPCKLKSVSSVVFLKTGREIRRTRGLSFSRPGVSKLMTTGSEGEDLFSLSPTMAGRSVVCGGVLELVSVAARERESESCEPGEGLEARAGEVMVRAEKGQRRGSER